MTTGTERKTTRTFRETRIYENIQFDVTEEYIKDVWRRCIYTRADKVST